MLVTRDYRGQGVIFLDAQPGRCAETLSFLGGQAQYIPNRRGQCLGIARHHYSATVPYDRRRVTHIRHNTGHRTGHGLADHVGKALAICRRADQHIHGAIEPLQIIAMSQ